MSDDVDHSKQVKLTEAFEAATPRPTGHIEMFGIRTRLIVPGDDLPRLLVAAFKDARIRPRDGDVLVLAESAVATAERRIFELDAVEPSDEARRMSAEWGLPVEQAHLVLQEADRVLGACKGVVLALKDGVLLANAGLDISNAPPGYAVGLPKDPNASAGAIRMALLTAFAANVGVVVADSRVLPLRLGCVGVALGTSGFEAVEDDRGKTDLFGRELSMTRVALADNIASAAELLMGETDRQVPAVLVRGAPISLSEREGVPLVREDECVYMGVLGRGDRSR
ncbi:MAG: coenzyme F420-0:L-glutamate ligase [Methanopyri archaeon]|jgi:coenzyme F420-0:L-glutamate ligase|nr:coenzyme F420-0:L-glutamate ligase [Methanopyri archaeon]